MNVIEDLSVAVMTSLQRQQALQRQLDDRQSRDPTTMTSPSRDADWLRDWLDEERKMRQDVMRSQELLQRTLIDCLHRANQQLTAGKVHQHQWVVDN